jgi:hypothetical protein
MSNIYLLHRAPASCNAASQGGERTTIIIITTYVHTVCTQVLYMMCMMAPAYSQQKCTSKRWSAYLPRCFFPSGTVAFVRDGILQYTAAAHARTHRTVMTATLAGLSSYHCLQYSAATDAATITILTSSSASRLPCPPTPHAPRRASSIIRRSFLSSAIPHSRPATTQTAACGLNAEWTDSPSRSFLAHHHLNISDLEGLHINSPQKPALLV